MQRQMLGETISTLRKKQGMTQAKLADIVGVSNKAVSKWETEEANPEMSLIPKIAKALGVSIGELFGEAVEVKKEEEEEAVVLQNAVCCPLKAAPETDTKSSTINKIRLAYAIVAIASAFVLVAGLVGASYLTFELVGVLRGKYDYRGAAYVRHETIEYSLGLSIAIIAIIVGLIMTIVFFRKYKGRKKR